MRKFTLGITLAAALCVALPTEAADPRPTAGFDGVYEAFQGDFDNDGDVDLYVRERPKIVILSFPIPIPVPLTTLSTVAPFVLLQDTHQAFSLRTNLAGLNVTARQPTPIKVRTIAVSRADDGRFTGVGQIIQGASGQIVFILSAAIR